MKLKEKIELIQQYNVSSKELEEVQKQVESYKKFLKDGKKTIEDVKMWEQKFEEKILRHIYNHNGLELYIHPESYATSIFENHELSIPVNFNLVDYFNSLTGDDIHYNKNKVDHTWYFNNGGKIHVTANEGKKFCYLYFYCPMNYLTDYLDSENIDYKIHENKSVEILY